MKEKQVSNARFYFLISRKWSKNTLMFWGSVSDDDKKRSFGGYTDDLRLCERYTLEEIESNNGHQKFLPFDINDWHKKTYHDETFYITKEQLEKHFNAPALVVLV